MRSLVAPLCTLAALALAAPAGAQFAQPHNYGPVSASNPFIGNGRPLAPGLGRELRDVRHRIHEEREAGLLSRHEARRLRREAAAIEASAERYERDGMSQSAQDELEARTHYPSGVVNRPH